MSRSIRQPQRSSRIANRKSNTGGSQDLSFSETSSSRDLQVSVPRNGTTSGVVTRKPSKRKLQYQAPQEDSSQHASKRKEKSKDNPPPLDDLFWIFYHKDSRVPESLRVTEDMLDKRLWDMYPLFALKIRERYRVNVNERTIHFFTPQQATKLDDVNLDWMENMLDQFGTYGTDKFTQATKRKLPILSPHLTMRRVLNSVSNDDDVLHLIVTAEDIQTEHSNTAAQEEDPNEPFFVKRFRNNLERGKEIQFTAPSTAERSLSYICEQSNDDMAIYDGCRGQYQTGSRIAPPIQIFHPVFENFYHYLHHPTCQPSTDLVRETYKFMEQASIISDEDDEAFERLSVILNRFIMTADESSITDETVWLTLDGLGMVLVVEVKREYGEGGCDPATKASFSFRNYWLQNKGLVEKCCCPTFIIAADGPWLAVLGGVFTDKFIVQRLTELTWTGYSSTYEDVRIHWLARIFNALFKCIDDLAKYYEKLKEAEFEPSDYFSWSPRRREEIGFKMFVKSRLFPYPRIFTEKDEHGQVQTRKFRYIRPLEEYSACVTYEAEICDGPLTEKIVVKFVARYGADVHRFLTEEGHAPKLRYFGPLLREDGTSAELSSAPWNFPGLYFGSIRMVVMDYIKKRPYNIHDHGHQIAEVLDKLHAKGFVFGDLRPPNVIFSKEDGKVKFIDFDWSGRYESIDDGSICDLKEDKRAHYPLGLSDRVEWPMELEKIGLELIKPEHDWYMLKEHFNYVPTRS